MSRQRWLLVAVSLVPLAVAGFGLLASIGEYRPSGDLAQQELRVRALGQHPVLVGPYSRDGWSHLGPTMYYLFVVPYRLFSESSLAILAAAVMVNAVALLGIFVIARRRGGQVVVVALMIGTALLLRSLGGGWARDPWNPYLTVLPFGLLLFLTWAMTCGSAKAMPAAFAVATFLVHTHIGYVPLAIPLLLLGVGWLVASACRTTGDRSSFDPHLSAVSRRDLGIHAGVSVILLAALWAAPIVDEVSNDPGNLTAVYRYFRHPPDALHSIGDGLRVMAEQFSLLPPWTSGDWDLAGLEPAALYHTVIPITLPVIAVAAVLLWRSGPPSAQRFIVTLGLAWITGVISVARTSGPVHAYRLHWASLLAMLSWSIVVWAASVSLTAQRRAAIAKPLMAMAVAVLVAMAGINSVAALRVDIRGRADSNRIEALLTQVEGDLARGHPGEIIFRDHGWRSWWIAYGLALGLDRALHIPSETRPVDSPVGPQDLTTHTVYIVAVDRQIIQYVNNPHYEFVALDTPEGHTIDVVETAVTTYGRVGIVQTIVGAAVFRQVANGALGG